MNLPNIIRRILHGVTLAGLAFFLMFVFRLMSTNQVGTSSALLSANTNILYEQQGKASAALPVRLKIPRINVDAAIEYVSLTPNKVMDTPNDPHKVAWFRPGPRPGEDGNAVIAGYLEEKNNNLAVFVNLYVLRKGDKLYIEDERGAVTTFVVREFRVYGENENAWDVFGPGDGKAHLNLVTYEGFWNTTDKNYLDRLVVFTDKETE